MRAARLFVVGLIAEALLLALATPADTAQIEKGKDLFVTAL
jgi:hypothetical protein